MEYSRNLHPIKILQTTGASACFVDSTKFWQLLLQRMTLKVKISFKPIKQPIQSQISDYIPNQPVWSADNKAFPYFCLSETTNRQILAKNLRTNRLLIMRNYGTYT